LTKAIFIFLGLLLALSMFSFPADTINAQPTTTPQLSPSSPAAMQVGEKELIDDILRELDQARKLTNDKDIQNQMGVIKEWVKKVQTLAERGETKAALEIKYTIAKRLEWLINQLPTATPGTTTAIAAMPASNPLYDELVRIRAKIDKLIDIEEREIPTEKPPPPPEIQRPPEMEKLIVYSAKFLCGPAFGGEGVQPGSYSTAINVHNPNNDTVYLFKKAVIAQREDEARGRISAFRKVVLNPDEAIEIDCIDIVRFFGAQQETGVGLTAPSQQAQTLLQTTAVRPLTSAVSFIKGFVVIYATAPLDVVGVYTASTPVGFSLDIEQIPRSTVGVPVRIPEEPEGEVCPPECRDCLTKEQAGKKYGPGGAVMCLQKECGWDKDPQTGERIPMFCWKPTVQPKCPDTCDCLTQAKIKELGTQVEFCQGQKIECGLDQSGYPMYCVQKAVTTYPECSKGCYCMTEAEARYKPYTWCQGKATRCGQDEQGNDKFCFQEVCQPPCECLTPEEAKGRGYIECTTQPRTVCVEDEKGNPVKWCFQKPIEEVCLQGCYCLTKDDAYGKLGPNATMCQNQPCGYVAGATAAMQIAKYCWKPGVPVEVKPTPGRILINPSQARNPVGSQHTITVVVYDINGKPMANVRVYIKHTGANSFAPIELTTDANGKCNYYYTGKNTGTDTIVATVDNISATATKEWYSVVKPAKIDLSPSMGRNAPGTSHTVTAAVWGTDGKPMPGIVVTFTVSGTNTASGSRTTDGYGRASFSYSSKLTGKDTITATAGGLTATATKYWERLQ